MYPRLDLDREAAEGYSKAAHVFASKTFQPDSKSGCMRFPETILPSLHGPFYLSFHGGFL